MLTTLWEDYGTGVDRENVHNTLSDLRWQMQDHFRGLLKISDESIDELRDLMSGTPILFADFDDTLTKRPDTQQANRSIHAILEKLETMPNKQRDVEAFKNADSWKKN